MSQNYYDNQNQNNEFQSKVAGNLFAGFSLITFLMFLWILSGFVAFVMSLICFTKSGTTTEHFLGLIIAFLFGPFYFLFFIFNKNYCRNKNKVN